MIGKILGWVLTHLDPNVDPRLNIYRPSKSNNDYGNVSTFIKEFHPVIDKLDKETSVLFLGGDFNINLLEIGHKERFQDFFDILISRGIFPKITLPTRFSTKSATLIDNIFCKTLANGINGMSGIFISKLSDHLPIFTCLDIIKTKSKSPKFVTVQENSPQAIDNFAKFISTAVNESEFDKNLISDPNRN